MVIGKLPSITDAVNTPEDRLAPDGSVAVLDNTNHFLEYTHPAKARKLLRDGVASVWSRKPFIIKLAKDVAQPTYKWRAQMATVNFTEYFKEERQVFVQNVSNGQVSLQFDLGGGRFESWLFDPSPRPLNLTQHFPFDVIKRSMEFRKMLSRRPPALVLVTEEEYNKLYSEVAKERGLFKTVVEKNKQVKVPDIDAAIELAEDERRRVQAKEPLPNAKPSEPLHDVVQDDPHFGGKKEVRARDLVMEDVINPRVLHLCNQVKAELTEQERMPANALMQELKMLDGQLKIDDWEYVRAHGWYNSVKKFAKTRIAALAESEGEADGEEQDG
jgi:hypothetical protein